MVAYFRFSKLLLDIKSSELLIQGCLDEMSVSLWIQNSFLQEHSSGKKNQGIYSSYKKIQMKDIIDIR